MIGTNDVIVKEKRDLTDTPFFSIRTHNIRIELNSDKIKSITLKEVDRKELLKLGDWLNKQEVRDLENSSNFTEDDLYSYIKQKAVTDEDFSTWWNDYDFKIGLYFYNLAIGFSDVRRLKIK